MKQQSKFSFGLFIFLALPFPTNAQTEAVITYICKKNHFEIETTLFVTEGGFYYKSHKENNELTTDRGITYYSYKDYVDWYLSKKDDIIFERRENKRYILNASWKPEMKWKIHDEIKQIEGYKTQKATTSSLRGGGHSFSDGGGISYEDDEAIAWFAIDLPFSAGPERYYGLPGLIIRLEYVKRSEICTLSNVLFQNVSDLKEPENDGVLVSKDEIINNFKIDKKWFKRQKKLLDKK